MELSPLNVAEVKNMITLATRSIFRTYAIDFIDAYAVVVGFYINPSMIDTALFRALFFALNSI